MEKKDLGSKKINGKQDINEDSTGKNVSNDTDSNSSRLHEELEIDANGNEKTVQRARNVAGTLENVPNDDEISNRGVSTEADVKKTTENRDRNSDITPNRYPNSNPDNHIDRGNQKLDEE